MKKKICFLIPGFGDGGAQKQCIYLLNEISKSEDLDITLIYFHDGVHDHLLDRERLRIMKLPTRSNYDPRNILAIRSILRKIKADILFTWLQSCDVYGFFLKRARPEMRWLMTERDSAYPNDPRFWLRRTLGRYADGIVANSEKGVDYWRRAHARGRLYTVSNIVSVNIQALSAARPLRIVTIGRLEKQKNVGPVIGAFTLLASRYPDVSFAVIGAGSEEAALKARVLGCGLAERIGFLGFRHDVPAQLRDARLAVSMSHHEGLPNVMLESVAADTLVVASDIPEHRELLGDSYPFYVADRTSPERIAQTIEAALHSWQNTTSLYPARTRVQAMAPAKVAARYREIFNDIVDKGSFG